MAREQLQRAPTHGCVRLVAVTQEQLQSQLEEAELKERGLSERAQSAERQLMEAVRREADAAARARTVEVRRRWACLLLRPMSPASHAVGSNMACAAGAARRLASCGPSVHVVVCCAVLPAGRAG